MQRIQNKSLFKQYAVHKEKLSKKQPNGNEMILFHGTSEDSVKSIYKFGFNRSLCGKNGYWIIVNNIKVLNKHFVLLLKALPMDKEFTLP